MNKITLLFSFILTLSCCGEVDTSALTNKMWDIANREFEEKGSWESEVQAYWKTVPATEREELLNAVVEKLKSIASNPKILPNPSDFVWRVGAIVLRFGTDEQIIEGYAPLLARDWEQGFKGLSLCRGPEGVKLILEKLNDIWTRLPSPEEMQHFDSLSDVDKRRIEILHDEIKQGYESLAGALHPSGPEVARRMKEKYLGYHSRIMSEEKFREFTERLEKNLRREKENREKFLRILGSETPRKHLRGRDSFKARATEIFPLAAAGSAGAITRVWLLAALLATCGGGVFLIVRQRRKSAGGEKKRS